MYHIFVSYICIIESSVNGKVSLKTGHAHSLSGTLKLWGACQACTLNRITKLGPGLMYQLISNCLTFRFKTLGVFLLITRISLVPMKRNHSVNTYSWISNVPRGSERSEWASPWMEWKKLQLSFDKRSSIWFLSL